MKTLIITEKPSVARDIAKVLKCNKKQNGYIYNETYIISWAIGHLVTLCEPQEYDEKFKKWNIQDLPIIPQKIKIKQIDKTKEQFKIIKELINRKDVNNLICATDSGREGELIFRYIYDITNCNKPFKRLWISSMTDDAIKDGFKNLKNSKEYDNLYYSAKCRAEADWLVGINSSRIFSLKFNTLISIGRVQTPTLAILVKRQKEINDFNSKDYFEIEATFLFEQNSKQLTYKAIFIDDKNKDTKIFDKNIADNILKQVHNKKGIVYSLEKEEKKQLPPLLYDLTELQRDCNKKFGYSAKKTLSLAQDLYEKHKFITYPRTDSRYLTEDIKSKIKIILNKLNSINFYKDFLYEILKDEKLKIGKRIIDNSKVSDHHAIIPTNFNFNIEILSQDEFNVFDLIVRRFLAVFYPNYIYEVTKIITKVENYSFLTKGTTIVQKGWIILNKNLDKEKDKKCEQKLPKVEKNMPVFNKNINSILKSTKPPLLYNDATLLSAMENAGRFVENEQLKEQLKDSGLGTPSTRAAIIERLIKMKYIIRKGKNLIPTEKGIKLIDIIPIELKSPETTGKWEKGLNLISKGQMDSNKFMQSINRYVDYIVKYAKNNNINVIFDDENNNIKNKNFLGKCFNCNGNILENLKSFYCTNWKNGCKFSIWKNSLIPWIPELKKKEIKILLNKEKIENFTVYNTNKKAFLVDIVFQDKKIGKLRLINLRKKD